MKIRKVTTEENEKWDHLITTSPQGDVFLLSFFLLAWENNDPEIHLHRVGYFDDQNNLLGGQAFLHKKKFGLVRTQCLLQTWSHIETPILGGHIVQGSPQGYAILKALADEAHKLFFLYRIFCHPTIVDVRAYLQAGWNVKPDYSHGWDIQYPEKLLLELGSKKRFKHIDGVVNNFDFADETTPTIIEEFLSLYKGTAQALSFRLRNSFNTMFRAMASEMMNRNQIRFLTCRKKNGELAAIATFVLNPIQKTAYGWQLAHIPLKGEKDFISALYYYSIKILSLEISFIDIAEGIHPSLYYFKDSMGTKSVPHFILKTPNANFWEGNVKALRNFKHRFINPFS